VVVHNNPFPASIKKESNLWPQRISNQLKVLLPQAKLVKALCIIEIGDCQVLSKLNRSVFHPSKKPACNPMNATENLRCVGFIPTQRIKGHIVIR
jgi:hypothetical protein